MGLYDEGTYGGGGIGMDRQSARDRYLDLLTKQRVNDQHMANKANAQMARDQRDASYADTGSATVKGVGMGMAFGPVGAIVGGALGKTAGMVSHGQKYGAWEGIKSGLNPFNDINALTNTASGQQVAQQAGNKYGNRDKLENDLLGTRNSFQLAKPGELRESSGGSPGLVGQQLAFEESLGDDLGPAPYTGEEDYKDPKFYRK